jgi:hypothetical protein
MSAEEEIIAHGLNRGLLNRLFLENGFDHFNMAVGLSETPRPVGELVAERWVRWVKRQ